MHCFQKKYFYVDIVKTAGTSIRSLLNANCCGMEHIGKHNFVWNKTWDWQQVPSLLTEYNKRFAKDRQIYASNFVDYFKFTFVRNPWDRLVSLYFWGQQIKPQPPYINVSFAEFVLLLDSRWDEYYRYFIDTKPMIDWVRNDQNQIPLNFIGKFETLDKDWLLICNRMNFACVELWHTYKTKHLHYSTYYNKKIKEIVGKLYEEDVEQFKYTFQTI
jgi:hypothetical protein